MNRTWWKSVWVVAALTLGGTLSTAAAEPTWVEAKLVSWDELQILYGGAAAFVDKGDTDGARLLVLASTDSLRAALQKTTLPAVRKQIAAYETLKPKAWAGVTVVDAAGFVPKMEAEAPALIEAAEKIALPPVGKGFEDAKDRCQRVLQAQAELPHAKELAKAYAKNAPSPEEHLKVEGSVAVTTPLRQIVFSSFTLPDHITLATQAAKEQAASFAEKTDKTVEAEALGSITMYASQEFEFGGYLEQLGEKELGAEHRAHAEAAIAIETKIREERVAANRLPKDSYAGDKGKLKAEVKTQFLRAYPKDKVLEVRLSGADFHEHRRWMKTDDGTWVWKKVRRYEWAHVAFQTPGTADTVCATMPLRVEQQWTGGKWSQMYTYKPLHIHGFTMLVENVKK